ncbi:helix-turn-helix domain-containing protein [Cellulosimicrobium cellulans]|uniref:helix-turn-helix domain-containing protein n=1 Tax=Cellulosimicrobium cellulans TaxID=1710 RepID=UPI00130E9262|nr:helix-turn-helix domain-containing protein [Cellulosimicrobium cellulans]
MLAHPRPADDGPEFVTVAAVARTLSVTERFVRERIACGDLPAVKVGAKAIRIRRTDVDALLHPVAAA